jgi:hypothetical protein
MAGFSTKTFLKHDDYMTPKTAWENIQHLIPKEKVIWESFHGDGKSGDDLKSLGFNVIHEPIDFFDDETLPEYDILISNPPFSKSKAVVQRLKELGKPFIIIMPSPKICTSYFRETFKDEKENPLQIIIPRKRIQFIKLVDGKIPNVYKSCCNFDCFYYCWKMNLERDITWLI